MYLILPSFPTGRCTYLYFVIMVWHSELNTGNKSRYNVNRYGVMKKPRRNTNHTLLFPHASRVSYKFWYIA